MKTYWIHVYMNHDSYSLLIAAITTIHNKRKPKSKLSINVNQYKTEALIKLPDVTDDDYAGQLANEIRTKGLLIRTFTEVDHDEAYLMVSDEAWTGPVE